MDTPAVTRCEMDNFIEAGKQDQPVYITHVRQNFLECDGIDLTLDLTKFNGGIRRVFLRVPAGEISTEEQSSFVREYLFAEVYNLLSALGGKRLDIYTDTSSASFMGILNEMPGSFGVGIPRKERAGYGRSVNVIERMLDSRGIPDGFAIEIHDKKQLPVLPAEPERAADMTGRFAKAFSGIEDKILCGVDIGGTDIKLSVSVRGKLCYLKEYDWFPALFTRSSQLIEPVRLLIRLLRARVSCDLASIGGPLTEALDRAITRHQPDAEILAAITAAEKELGGKITGFDGIGLCFPDVVILNKIVGGEVFKTRGIRNNPGVEYEAEFRRLMNLDELLAEYCAPGGRVRMTNDGPMAAFTAAMELIAQGKGSRLRDGRFAHTLGTELGTGWIDEAGEIPEIPLEVYNFIIDLGSFAARQYHPDDLRSINNFNTGLPGTLQKFMAQNGVFRLAIKSSQAGDGRLYRELLAGGYIEEKNGGVFVILEPKDMRKPLLEFLMKGCEAGDPGMEAVFLEIGRSTGITYCETEHVLSPRTKERVMYGRLVKTPRCFDLIRRGAEQVDASLEMSVADEQNAFSDLMLQLKAHPVYTVAQFAQSVGALYYGNLPE